MSLCRQICPLSSSIPEQNSQGQPHMLTMGANREGDFSRWFICNHRPRQLELTVGNLTRRISKSCKAGHKLCSMVRKRPSRPCPAGAHRLAALISLPDHAAPAGGEGEKAFCLRRGSFSKASILPDRYLCFFCLNSSKLCSNQLFWIIIPVGTVLSYDTMRL